MLECQPSIIASGNAILTWIAAHREPWLTPFFQFFSDFGRTVGLLSTISLAYWYWNKRITKYLVYGAFGSLFLNLLLKGWFQECRPPHDLWLENVHMSYSFPSGHAQVTPILWWGFAFYAKSPLTRFVCALIGLLIVISRPYLGVHYVHDVLVGGCLALLILLLCIHCEKKHFALFRSLPLWTQMLMMILALGSIQALINVPGSLPTRGVATLFGFWLGCQLEAKRLFYTPPASFFPKAVFFLIGLTGTLIVYFAGSFLAGLLSSAMLMPFLYVQYALLGLWISFGAPFVFQRSLNKNSTPSINSKSLH